MKIYHTQIPVHVGEVALARFVVSVGSSLESDGELGITHFLEHVLYTKLEKYLRAHQLGYATNSLSATTHRDRLEFDVALALEDRGEIDALISLIHEPLTLSQSDVAREKAILIRELSEEESDPDFIHDRAETEWLYRSPYAQPNGGTQASIQSITTKQLIAWHERYIRQGSGLLMTSFAMHDNAKYHPFSHQPISVAGSNFGPAHDAGSTRIPRVSGDDTVLHAYVFSEVRNEHENNYSILVNYYLGERLRQYFDRSGESYYYGADVYTVGGVTEHSLTATVLDEKVDTVRKFMIELIGSVKRLSRSEFLALRDDARRTLAISDANPIMQFENVAFAAAEWGDDWEGYQSASRELATITRDDFKRFVLSTGLGEGKVWLVVRSGS